MYRLKCNCCNWGKLIWKVALWCNTQLAGWCKKQTCILACLHWFAVNYSDPSSSLLVCVQSSHSTCISAYRFILYIWLHYMKNSFKDQVSLHSNAYRNTTLWSHQFKCFGYQYRLVSSQQYSKIYIQISN